MWEPLFVRRIMRVAGSACVAVSGARIAVAAVGRNVRRRSIAGAATIIGLCGMQVLLLSVALLSRGAEITGKNSDSNEGSPLLFSLAELTEEDDDEESDLPQDGMAPAAKLLLQGGSTVSEPSASVPIRAWAACGIAYSRPPPRVDPCPRAGPEPGRVKRHLPLRAS